MSARVGVTYTHPVQIVISGTHSSGKSTLVSDFTMQHPGFEVLPDPFELIDEAWDRPSAGMFVAQLTLAASRLAPDPTGAPTADRIAERGPLDFLAYLLAIEDLSGGSLDADLLEGARQLTADAIRHVDVLVVLPLTHDDALAPGAEEHLALRVAMNEALLELVEDPELCDPGMTVAEIVGDPAARCAELERLVAAWRAERVARTSGAIRSTSIRSAPQRPRGILMPCLASVVDPSARGVCDSMPPTA